MKRAGGASNRDFNTKQAPESYYKNPSYYPGKMGKADMPADSQMRDWPIRKNSDYAPLDDTMAGIESVQEESFRKAKSNVSYQK